MLHSEAERKRSEIIRDRMRKLEDNRGMTPDQLRKYDKLADAYNAIITR